MSSRAERSVAKDLEDIKQWKIDVDVHEILPPYGRLNDKMQRIIEKKTQWNSVSSVVQKKEIINHKSKMNKEIWSKILNIVITVLTAIATTFGVTSCMGV